MNWILKHANFFNNRSEEWNATYAAWHEFFTEEGAKPAQLEAAVRAVAKRSKVPVFASEHLNALKEELREIRNRDYENTVKAARERTPRCSTCEFQATLIVPNGLSEATLETWMGQELSVVCDRCDMARIEGHRGMTLGEYEAKNPNWRELYARWNAIRSGQSKSAPSATETRYQAAKARLVAHVSTALEKGVNQ